MVSAVEHDVLALALKGRFARSLEARDAVATCTRRKRVRTLGDPAAGPGPRRRKKARTAGARGVQTAAYRRQLTAHFVAGFSAPTKRRRSPALVQAEASSP
jgi:hypothetical protein